MGVICVYDEAKSKQRKFKNKWNLSNSVFESYEKNINASKSKQTNKKCKKEKKYLSNKNNKIIENNDNNYLKNTEISDKKIEINEIVNEDIKIEVDIERLSKEDNLDKCIENRNKDKSISDNKENIETNSNKNLTEENSEKSEYDFECNDKERINLNKLSDKGRLNSFIKYSYKVTMIFKSKDFQLEDDELFNKFPNEKEALSELKEIEKGLIIDGCLLNKNDLDYRGNNIGEGWGKIQEKRGNENYIPPSDWIGYGIRVYNKYNDNNWLGMNNNEGEWSVAYHGVACNNSFPKEVSKITGDIIRTGFNQSLSGKITNHPDIRHPNQKCGLGVYCSPDINYAKSYAGITELNGKKYKCVLMLRVNNDKIRQSSTYPKEYILEPTTDEIRPYRILFKKC